MILELQFEVSLLLVIQCDLAVFFCLQSAHLGYLAKIMDSQAL